jgi:hypothetical protein
LLLDPREREGSARSRQGGAIICASTDQRTRHFLQRIGYLKRNSTMRELKNIYASGIFPTMESSR